MIHLPQDYIQKMQELLQEDFPSFLQSYDKERQLGFRINPLKISVKDFWEKYGEICSFSAKNIPWCNTGFYYPSDANLSKLSLYHAGLYYLQEPSAMSPVEFLDIQPGQNVLDLCAAPGGKSIQIAEKMNRSGLLISNDISLKRTKAILKNVEMHGISNCIITNTEPQRMAPALYEFFDRILVDAPCSGEGMFRKSPDLIKSYHDVLKEIVAIQQEILSSAATMCKVGGLIVYSTCTFNRDENEAVIEDFLANHPNFELVNLFEKYPEAERYSFVSGIGMDAFRLFPHKLEGEGHFLALLKKKHSSPAPTVEQKKVDKEKKKNPKYKEKQSSPTVNIDALLLDFETNSLHTKLSRDSITYSNGSLYQEIDIGNRLNDVRIIRNGLYLGDIKNNQLIPSPAFLMASKKSDFRQSISFSADDPQIYKYLRCETLSIPKEDGYCVICLDEHPLGLVKIKNGMAKNLYHPNWRLL